jgi:predicted DNA-binding transcriptional regulator AlpA
LTRCIKSSIVLPMSKITLEVSNLVNYNQAAKIIGVTRATIYAMISRGELHPVVIADRRYLLKSEVTRVLNEHNSDQS